MSEFKTVIGLEIHVQLKTESKMFCGCDNNAQDAESNTLVCPVCLGLPGVLPYPNAQAIEWTLKTGLALNCEIAPFSKFDRKHYFYPDLPKGYQISQYDLPFLTGGFLNIQSNESKKIRFIRIHLEEDAGKLIHEGSETYVDLNRAGTPLMEIVTEPDIESPQDAKIFLQELRSVLRYLNVSDADMEKGHLRCDANISLHREGEDKLSGTPVEIKNLNSFRFVERALVFEEKRQRELLQKGEKITKETRGWDEKSQTTVSQRSKEQAQDYRYFPEPDIPPFEVFKAFDIDQIKASLPELPFQKREKYIGKWQLNQTDAQLLALEPNICNYFEKVAEKVSPKFAANWIINELKFENVGKISAEKLIELIKLVEENVVSGKIAKDVLAQMLASGKSASDIIKLQGLKQLGSEEELLPIIKELLNENPQAVQDLKDGKNQALGFLVGQVMSKTKGQANPQMVNQIISKLIKE